MEQHAIPQQISSYQFRLVGDMTLKQFFQLAGGILIGIIFYSAPIPEIVKWPFAIVSVILGIGLAFFPLGERPLERWIFAFFRAIYTPTEFYWKKTNAPVKFFQDESATPPPTVAAPAQEEALKTYLSTASRTPGPLSKLEGAEKGFLAAIGGLFAGLKGSTGITPTPTPVTTEAPPIEKKEMKIPVMEPVRIVQPNPSRLVVEEKVQAVTPQNTIQEQKVSPVIAGDEIVSTRQAVFSAEAAPPSPPTYPNVVVGQVVDEHKRIVEGAIMEIRDEAGRPVRALRSNKVGHFVTVTPLDSGRYDIVTEKEGYQFPPVSFDAAGQIVPPILVEGKVVAAQTQ